MVIIQNKHKTTIIKSEYEKLSINLQDMIIHINNIYQHCIIVQSQYFDLLKQLDNLILKLNYAYNDLIDNFNCDWVINTNLDKITDWSVFIENYQAINYDEQKKINNFILHFMPQFYFIKKQIIKIGKSYGFCQIISGLNLLISPAYDFFINVKLYKKIYRLSKIFVPISFQMKRKNTKSNIQIEKIINNNNLKINNYVSINITINNCCYIFTGFFINDSLNNIVKTSQICCPEINLKKVFLQKQICNDAFAKNIIQYFPYYYYLIDDTNFLFNEIDKYKKLTLQISNIDKNNLSKLFLNSNLNAMFDIILLLLIQFKFDDVYALFNQINNNKIKNIIYLNLHFSLQIKLKYSKIINSNNTCIQNNYEQEIINSNMPIYIQKYALDKMREIKTINTDNYKPVLYIETLLKYPWATNKINNLLVSNNNSTKFIQNAIQIFNNEIYGQNTCKQYIFELICKWISNPNCYGDTIGFVGPPGVGKTLIAKTLGKVFQIPFTQILLGGQNDADILYGHNYTYNHSQPGLIIKRIIEAKTTRCIIFFDELDKTSSKNNTNEIQNALIHLTDPQTNINFQDKFFQDITFPLKNTLFIFSYNNPERINPILYDRIHEIEIKPYQLYDKINIAKQFLLPSICQDINFDLTKIQISNEILTYIIENYTSESGLRIFNQKLYKIILKLNYDLIFEHKLFYDNSVSFNIDYNIIHQILGKPETFIYPIANHNQIGVINSLYATTDTNGGILPIQVFYNFNKSTKFHIKITGNQGSIMQESAQTAFTAATHLIKYSIIQKYMTNYPYGFHLHIPNNQIKKDGSSAGCAMAIAFISRILEKKIHNHIAITGELDLTGKIYRISNLFAKLNAAKKAGIAQIIIPQENYDDYHNILKHNPNILDNHFNIIFVNYLSDAVKHSISDFIIDDLNS